MKKVIFGMCHSKKMTAAEPEKSRHQFLVSKAKQALNLLSSLTVLFVLLGSAGCEKKKVKPKPNCYEGEVIAIFYCNGNVVQMKNANLGKTIRINNQSYNNCVTIVNLPDNYPSIGQRVSFSDYQMENDFACQTLYSGDIPGIIIKNTNCNNNEN